MKNKLLFLASSLILTSILFSGCRRHDPEVDGVYRFLEIMKVDGLDRRYLLNLPPNYYESSSADFSVVIAMHGGGGDANQFESTSKLTEKANAAKFIVVYPEGVQSDGLLKLRTWNAGGCCDYARDHNINDVKFISELIDKLVANYKINPKKVYATGHSNGGMLSYRLACELSNKVAAIAPNGCTMVVKQPCNPSRAVPVLHMHSILDENVPYQGGYGTSNAYYPPLDSILNVWSNNDACQNKAQVVVNDEKYKLTKWTNCSNNTTIHYYLTQDGGHGWPGGDPGREGSDTPSKVINANDLLWEFFQQFELP
jgi:polyhydroxybutyrate depolymerase